jgi:glycosyltransferase involved in cell wall biosynthesis
VYDAQAIEDQWRKAYGRTGAVIEYGGDPPGPLPVVDGLEHRGYVLLVARFVPENTVLEFLDAAVDLSRETDVVLVGSSGYGGPLDDRVASLAAQNERIHWLGHVSDDDLLFSLWQHAGVYFHGHSVGGTNPALVQAMACGAPIVARDTIYNREVLGEAGSFVAPDSGAITDAVLSLLSAPERQEASSNSALERARERYPWTRICQAYGDVLRTVLPQRRDGGGTQPLARP